MKKSRLLVQWLAITGCVLIVSMSAPAALLVYDGFTNVTSGGSGWLSWSSWGGLNLGANVAYGALQTTGGSAVNPDQYAGPGREFNTIDSSTIWISWVQSNIAAVSRNAQVNITKEGSRRFGIGQKKDEGTTTFHIYNANDDLAVDTGVSDNGLNFVALSVNLTSGLINLYINPTGLGSGAAPSSAITTNWTRGGTWTDIGQVGLKTGDSTFTFDEFRIGNTWADVSPITAIPSYTISGTITNSVSGAGMVSVVVSDGTRSGTSASDGTYSITNVPNGTYTLTPTLSSFNFSPETRAAVVSSADLTEQNFAAIPEPAALLLLPLLVLGLRLKS